MKTRNYITSLTLNKLPAAMRLKYEDFIAEGSLIVMEGTVLDLMQVYEDLENEQKSSPCERSHPRAHGSCQNFCRR